MKRSREQRLIIIVSGPSGAGKRSIINGLLGHRRKMRPVFGTTTRPQAKRRGGDTTLQFVTPAQFGALRKRGAFLETARVRAHQFGTQRADVDKILRAGKVPLLELDVKGHAKVRRQRLFHVCSLFITAGSLNVLRKRALFRQPDLTREELALRMREARRELARQREYDAVIVNRQGLLTRAIRDALQAVDRCLGGRYPAPTYAKRRKS